MLALVLAASPLAANRHAALQPWLVPPSDPKQLVEQQKKLADRHGAFEITAVSAGPREAMMSRWTALGDRWWLPFVDGYAQNAVSKGEVAPGYTEHETRMDQGRLVDDGDLVQLRAVFVNFLGNSSALAARWTADRLLRVNQEARAHDGKLPSNDWTCHLPRHDEERVMKVDGQGAVRHCKVVVDALDRFQQPPKNKHTTCDFEHNGPRCRCATEKARFLDDALLCT